ncbi:MAG: hypothetical protein GY694_07040 [Gammaproteobacteria bacterium]|nr:hypothetical protein [Gammaproteobacteria bacterium]
MLSHRILFDHSLKTESSPVLEMAMLGHCPGNVNLKALTHNMRSLIRSNGYGLQMDCLETMFSASSEEDLTETFSTQKISAYNDIDQKSLAQLFHLPIPLNSFSEFTSLFPNAHNTASLYQSKIAGDYAWLGLSVKDFFTSGGELLWIVRIPEGEQQAGFLPSIKKGIHDSAGLKGLATLFPVNSIGLVAFPDLERLQLQSFIKNEPRKNLKNPAPEFLPCNTVQMDDHRERRWSSELDTQPEPVALQSIISPMMHHIEKYRPDLMCLYTPALEYDVQNNQALLSPSDIDAINELKSLQPEANYLRHIQFIFPYLQGVDYPLKSASGYVGGTQCANAKRNGIWRSIAGLSLNVNGTPYPAINTNQLNLYRQQYGLSTFYDQGKIITLDDEQLTVSAINLNNTNFKQGNVNHIFTKENLEKNRSAEIKRFMGFLLRELKQLGESLIFNTDAQDPAPRILLESYFNQLYQAGALRGSNETEAFSIVNNSSVTTDNIIQYDIQLRPAYPIDSIKLIFNRINHNWEVNAHG